MYNGSEFTREVIMKFLSKQFYPFIDFVTV